MRPPRAGRAAAFTLIELLPGNNAFAPPNGVGSSTNIFGKKVYPAISTFSTGWTSDHAPLCQVKTAKDGLGYPITGPIWADSDNRLTVTGTDSTGTANIGSGPCVMNCNNLQGDIYSFHTGGANTVFADGSVRFVHDTISIVTLAALVTKASGEVVDSSNS